MAVSKRVRYEVLRRDNYACRYCGATAGSGAQLVVDHVMPVSLGGTDDPTNLVACCRDCNAGKASTRPDDDVVADAEQAALRYAHAIRQATADLESARAPERDYVATFADEWDTFRSGFNGKYEVPKPGNWSQSIEQFYRAGLPIEALIDAVHLAMGNSKVGQDRVWRYMCGICWNRIREIQGRALEILAAEDVDRMR